MLQLGVGGQATGPAMIRVGLALPTVHGIEVGLQLGRRGRLVGFGPPLAGALGTLDHAVVLGPSRRIDSHLDAKSGQPELQPGGQVAFGPPRRTVVNPNSLRQSSSCEATTERRLGLPGRHAAPEPEGEKPRSPGPPRCIHRRSEPTGLALGQLHLVGRVDLPGLVRSLGSWIGSATTPTGGRGIQSGLDEGSLDRPYTGKDSVGMLLGEDHADDPGPPGRVLASHRDHLADQSGVGPACLIPTTPGVIGGDRDEPGLGETGDEVSDGPGMEPQVVGDGVGMMAKASPQEDHLPLGSRNGSSHRKPPDNGQLSEQIAFSIRSLNTLRNNSMSRFPRNNLMSCDRVPQTPATRPSSKAVHTQDALTVVEDGDWLPARKTALEPENRTQAGCLSPSSGHHGREPLERITGDVGESVISGPSSERSFLMEL